MAAGAVVLGAVDPGRNVSGRYYWTPQAHYDEHRPHRALGQRVRSGPHQIRSASPTRRTYDGTRSSEASFTSTD